MRPIVILVVFLGAVYCSYGDPPHGTAQTTQPPHAQPVELLLGEPVTAWTAAYGQPRSANERNAIYQIQAGTAYVAFGSTGLAESASFVANLTDMDRLVAIVTEVCQSLGVGYKDDAVGPKGKFHRYENKDGGIRAAITATPPQLVIIVQTKAFGASDASPMTVAIWK
jgi:hypothetical protein